MDHSLAKLAGLHAGGGTVRLIMLHPSGDEHIALGLLAAWKSIVPAADLSTLPVPDGASACTIRETVSRTLEWEGVVPPRLVLAGFGGAQDAAVQLAFGPAGLECAGVLALGDGPLPLSSLPGHCGPGRPKLRLIWTAADPPCCTAALSGLLRRLRAAGLDAQGAVLSRDRRAPEADGGPALPLVRLGGAYLGELVAVALGFAPPPTGRRGPSLAT